mmetsp:Transcript_6969/g.13825  ORF Transcript_6969/g.13825 Transcript_6969/m.13825 type:complete len:285 (+) Transcript_6969:134-988(+)
MSRVSASLAVWLRGCRGGKAARRQKPPPAPKLLLFEYEGSPWCRRVREHLCQLDLKVNMRPCPREVLFSHIGPPIHAEGWHGSKSLFREEVKARGGKLVFPFLVDDTLGVAMNESGDIVRHLWRHYADGICEDTDMRPTSSYNLASFKALAPLEEGVCVQPPSHVAWKILDVPTLIAASVLRPLPHHGVMITPSATPDDGREITLHGNEACAGSRLVREALCTLQIPYVLIPCTQGGAFVSPTGATPYLQDGSFLSSDAEEAVKHLFRTYARGPPLSWWSRKTR